MSSVDSSKPADPAAAAVLEFWLGDCADPDAVKRRGRLWFASTPAQDEEIRSRFAELHDRARAGELDGWTDEPRGALALVVLLDQFTRNLYRGMGSAFANDPRSLAIARSAIDRGFDLKLQTVERAFLYMPFQHSESLEDQERSIRLYRTLLDDSPPPLKAFARSGLEYAVLHRDIIARFGRFPHRNELLGRTATQAEQRYLAEGGHRFGQG